MLVIVEVTAARHALEAQTPRTMELFRGITDPSIPIPGSEWAVGEAAAHVAIGAEGYSEYARGLSASIPSTWRTWREARAAASMRCQNVMGASWQKCSRRASSSSSTPRKGGQQMIFCAGKAT